MRKQKSYSRKCDPIPNYDPYDDKFLKGSPCSKHYKDNDFDKYATFNKYSSPTMSKREIAIQSDNLSRPRNSQNCQQCK